MTEYNEHTLEELRIRKLDNIPALIGFGRYVDRSPLKMSEDEIKIRDRNASILANTNVASTVAIIYGIIEGINYLMR